MPKTRIYKTVILPLALCSHETCKLQVSGNKVIREIFGFEKYEGLNSVG
jgi:hypothetical protein